jgi:hypothetical protein
MRNLCTVFLIVFLIAFPLLALTQGLPDKGAGTASTPVVATIQKQTLKPAHLTGGRMRLLQQNTGMSTDEISRLYAVSGAKNFGQFTCAVLVSQQLKLDRDAVLQGLYANNLGQVVKRMGVDNTVARDRIVAAIHEMLGAEKDLAVR